MDSDLQPAVAKRLDYLRTERHIDAMVALDNFDLLTARVRKLLSYNRRMAMTERFTYIDEPPKLLVGCVADTDTRDGGITEGTTSGGKWFTVYLRPGLLTGFGISAYSHDDNATEGDAWKRYHAGKDATDHWAKRRNMTRLTICGGREGDTGPGRDDLIVIRAWNPDGVCEEKVIGFDTDAYWAARDTEAVA